MGFTKRELIWFFNKMTSMVSEEHKEEADKMVSLFIREYEQSCEYEPESISKMPSAIIPPYYVAAMPKVLRDEIKQIIECRLKTKGTYTPEMLEQAMNSKIYDLNGLIDAREYVRRMEEMKSDFHCQNRGER